VKPRAIKQVLVTVVALLGAVSIIAPVVAQSQNGKGKGKRDKGDFVRGHENSKAKRVTPPKTELEAIVNRRVAAYGIVELELPEDRMVDLVAVRHADGTVTYQHLAEGESLPAQDKQGEVK